jgi:hypothetical protein
MPRGSDVHLLAHCKMLAAAASGAFAKLETVRAWTPAEFKGIQEKAGRIGAGFKPPAT